MTDEPASWLTIERGWTVAAADGSEIGSVDEVVGDSTADIFDGLTLKTGTFAAPRYVPAERVGHIAPGRVELELSTAEVEALGEYEPPGREERILPETASWTERIAGFFRRGFRGRV
ncbi:MAG: DUF2171 domain-containing protein [Actinomycetota bacterium]|nr:DUF2171 domain-containing protein [Actinomycetota bacterium]